MLKELGRAVLTGVAVSAGVDAVKSAAKDVRRRHRRFMAKRAIEKARAEQREADELEELKRKLRDS